jgi:hypothetical protein
MHRSKESDSNPYAEEEYLTITDLENFLWFRTEKYSGVLQPFIPPQGDYNKTIRVTWTPNVMIAEVRTCSTGIRSHLLHS